MSRIESGGPNQNGPFSFSQLFSSLATRINSFIESLFSKKEEPSKPRQITPTVSAPQIIREKRSIESTLKFFDQDQILEHESLYLELRKKSKDDIGLIKEIATFDPKTRNGVFEAFIHDDEFLAHSALATLLSIDESLFNEMFFNLHPPIQRAFFQDVCLHKRQFVEIDLSTLVKNHVKNYLSSHAFDFSYEKLQSLHHLLPRDAMSHVVHEMKKSASSDFNLRNQEAKYFKIIAFLHPDIFKDYQQHPVLEKSKLSSLACRILHLEPSLDFIKKVMISNLNIHDLDFSKIDPHLRLELEHVLTSHGPLSTEKKIALELKLLETKDPAYSKQYYHFDSSNMAQKVAYICALLSVHSESVAVAEKLISKLTKEDLSNISGLIPSLYTKRLQVSALLDPRIIKAANEKGLQDFVSTLALVLIEKGPKDTSSIFSKIKHLDTETRASLYSLILNKYEKNSAICLQALNFWADEFIFSEKLPDTLIDHAISLFEKEKLGVNALTASSFSEKISEDPRFKHFSDKGHKMVSNLFYDLSSLTQRSFFSVLPSKFSQTFLEQKNEIILDLLQDVDAARAKVETRLETIKKEKQSLEQTRPNFYQKTHTVIGLDEKVDDREYLKYLDTEIIASKTILSFIDKLIACKYRPGSLKKELKENDFSAIALTDPIKVALLSFIYGSDFLVEVFLKEAQDKHQSLNYLTKSPEFLKPFEKAIEGQLKKDSLLAITCHQNGLISDEMLLKSCIFLNKDGNLTINNELINKLNQDELRLLKKYADKKYPESQEIHLNIIKHLGFGSLISHEAGREKLNLGLLNFLDERSLKEALVYFKTNYPKLSDAIFTIQDRLSQKQYLNQELKSLNLLKACIYPKDEKSLHVNSGLAANLTKDELLELTKFIQNKYSQANNLKSVLLFLKEIVLSKT